MTIETEEKTLLWGTVSGKLQPGIFGFSTLTWCPACRSEVEMVTPEHAAQIAGVSERTVHGWIEAKSVHFLEVRGNLRICVATLSQSTTERGKHPSKIANGTAAG